MKMTFRDLVVEFCTRKLAQQLYECVECSHCDRAATDWFVAKWFVKMNYGTVDLIMAKFRTLVAEDQICSTTVIDNTLFLGLRFSYESFDHLCGRDVWDKLYQSLKKQMPNSIHTRIRFG